MDIKFIALDLDETLTNDKKEITPLTREALLKAASMGIHLVLASGRPIFGMEPPAEALNLRENGGFILANNGGQILDCKTGEIISQTLFPLEYIDGVVEFAKENGVPVVTYDKTHIISNVEPDEYVRIDSFNNCNAPIRVADLNSDALGFDIIKLVLEASPEKVAEMTPVLSAQFAGKLDIYRSGKYFLEVMPLGMHKAEGLRILLENQGYTRKNLMAFGDSHNDITMIDYAGLGVAMANSIPEVLAVADFVTKSNNEDGVAFAINKFIFGE